MDISADLAAVQSRIAEITGAPPAAAPATASPAAQQTAPGAFASLVRSALHGSNFAAPDQGAEGPGATAFGASGAGGASTASAPLPDPQLEGLVNSSAAAWQVDPALVKAIIANESAFNPGATSRTGAQGLMQLEPATAASLGVTDAYDPAQNISGGTRYIRGLLDRFHGDVRLAVAAYNAGPGAVERFNGIPPYAETQNYVGNVLASYQKYKDASP